MSVYTTLAPVVLEPASQAFVEATAKPPFLYELDPDRGARGPRRRAGGADRQARPSTSAGSPCPADVGDVRVRIVRPPDADRAAARRSCTCTAAAGCSATPPPTTGSSASWPSASAPPSSSSSTTARRRRSYPVAIEQGYATARWITREGAGQRPRPEAHGGRRRLGRRQHDRRAGADGQQTRRRHASCTSRCTTRSPTPRMDTGSLRAVRRGLLPHREGDGVVLGRLRAGRRAARGAYASPLRASDEQLAGLPPALRDRRRGRRAARRGRGVRARACAKAGVAVTTVRYDGITHDFMMLNPLSDTHATRAAVAQAISVLRQALDRR